jgi:hypothetical protein
MGDYFQVCTSEVRCFCHLDFTGDDCSIIKNKTRILPTTERPPTTFPPNATLLPPLNVEGKTTEVESFPIPQGLLCGMPFGRCYRNLFCRGSGQHAVVDHCSGLRSWWGVVHFPLLLSMLSVSDLTRFYPVLE